MIPHVLRSLVRLKAPEVDDDAARAAQGRRTIVIRETAAGADRPAEAGRRRWPCCARPMRPDSPTRRTARERRRCRRWPPTGRGRGRGVRAALADKDWAVRVRAAELLTKLDPSGDHRQAIRPVPGAPIAPYDDPQLAAPPNVTARLHRDRARHDRVRARGARRAADRAQLHRAGAQGLLQRPAGAPRRRRTS